MIELRDYQSQAIEECWQALKSSDEPVVLMASVGAGKSLMISFIIKKMEDLKKRVLCIVNNAELVRNNHEAYTSVGGNADIYCAALGDKKCSKPIVFGTPQTIVNGITKNENIATIDFNLIVVDECHAINHLNFKSSFIRIFEHYKRRYNPMRILGATGTPFRFRGSAIVGDSCLFRKTVGNITTERLIREGYLVKPVFEIDKQHQIDFKHVKVKSNGLFDQKQLQEVVRKNKRLTETISEQIIRIMQHRFGVFIFATTKKHAIEILSYLPPEESALILGDTKQNERTQILNKARKGEIKYLVNISIISVGVDVPPYDTIAYLRPTESLVLMVQTMGRGLRLAPNKESCLILDYAGNIERHQEWDNPIILDALKQTIDKDEPLVMVCHKCGGMNTQYARRCTHISNGIRCDYYFTYKECPNGLCKVKNDIASRNCWACSAEIIDPNQKLRLIKETKEYFELHVIETKFWITGPLLGYKFNAKYKCIDANGHQHQVYESYYTGSTQSLKIFYHNFISKHCNQPSKIYPLLRIKTKFESILSEIKAPIKLFVYIKNNKVKIRKKEFEINIKQLGVNNEKSNSLHDDCINV